MTLKNKKIMLLITLVLIIVIACLYQYNQNRFEVKNKEIIRVGIIFNEAGLGDKSFNDLCYDGILKAQEKLGIEFDYCQSKTKDDYETLGREYAKTKQYDLIISVGGEQEKAIIKMSKEFPNQKFTLIDSNIELPNVSSICTSWSEQTFLNGVIAGLSITNNSKQEKNKPVAGVILGKDLEHLRQGAIGFEAGVRYINPNIKTMVAVVDDFSNPAKAKEIALLMYKKGAQYIQQLAGESGFGVFAAAKEADRYAFGVDGNQNFFDPDYIVSTATRYANEIIYKEIEGIKNYTWSPGVHKLGLKENVIGYEIEGSNVKIDSKIIETVEKIKTSVIKKEIVIPSTYEGLDTWITNNKYKS